MVVLKLNEEPSRAGPALQAAAHTWRPEQDHRLATLSRPEHTYTHTHYKRNITLLNLLSFPVYSGCVSWGLFTFNKIEYERVLKCHIVTALVLQVACSLTQFLETTGWEFGKYFARQRKEC